MKCPCKECISYAICNAIIKNVSIGFQPSVISLAEEKDCQDLIKFINPGFYKVTKAQINEAMRMFKLRSLP